MEKYLIYREDGTLFASIPGWHECMAMFSILCLYSDDLYEIRDEDGTVVMDRLSIG